MKHSASVIGAMGIAVGTNSGTAGAIEIDPNLNDPARNYPWTVRVDDKAKVTLYLLQNNLSLKKLVYTRSLVEVFEHMIGRLRNADSDAVYRVNSILRAYDDQYDAKSLQAELQRVADLLGSSRGSYIEYSEGKKYTISDLFQAQLKSLQLKIAMPLDRDKTLCIRRFIEKDLERKFRSYGHLNDIEGLFLKPKRKFGRPSDRPTDFPSRPREMDSIHHARDCGLLWCNPRDEYAQLHNGPLPVQQGNEYECEWDASKQEYYCRETGDPDDYCEIVDGECSGMST